MVDSRCLVTGMVQPNVSFFADMKGREWCSYCGRWIPGDGRYALCELEVLCASCGDVYVNEHVCSFPRRSHDYLFEVCRQFYHSPLPFERCEEVFLCETCGGTNKLHTRNTRVKPCQPANGPHQQAMVSFHPYLAVI